MPGLPRVKQFLRSVSGSILLNDRPSLTVLMFLAAGLVACAFYFGVSQIVQMVADRPAVNIPGHNAPDPFSASVVADMPVYWSGPVLSASPNLTGRLWLAEDGSVQNSPEPDAPGVKAVSYVEGRDVSLPDAVHQADVALLRALGLARVAPADLMVLESQTRFSRNGTAYPYLRLNFPADISQRVDFSQMTRLLRESLQLCAPRAVLRVERGPDLLFIQIDGHITHSLTFGDSSMGLLAQAEIKSAWLCIIIDDIGEDMAALHKLLDLPYPVTLSVWPHSTNAAYASALSAARGRQVFIHLPMQPEREERRAIIPETIRVGAAASEIAKVLEYSRSMVPDAEGLNNHMGSRFTSNFGATRGFCAQLQKIWPQALVVDSLTHQGSVFYDLAVDFGLNAFRRSLFLDEEDTKAAILRQLDNGLALARQKGWAIVIGHPRPATLEALRAWQGYLDPEVLLARIPVIR